MSSCAWCNDDGVLEARVSASLKVPVCRRHMEMIQRNREEKHRRDLQTRLARDMRARAGATGGIR